MAEIYDWDIVAANNNSAPPDGAPENMNYQEVNDTMREMMAVVARFVTSIRGATPTAGSSNAYTLVSGLTIGAYEAGQIFSFIADRTSTGSVTLNVDGLGASNLVDSTGVQCGSGDIESGSVYAVVRRASDFQLLGTFTRSGILALSQITFNKAYTTGGSSNAYTVTTGFSLAALTTGMVFALIPDRANTGAATLNVDGIGAVAWEDDESLALAANDIQTGVPVIVVYNGTEFRTLCGIPINLATFVSGTLPIGNGGTGQTSAANAFGALKQNATTSATGVVELATDAEVRAAASGVVLTTDLIETASASVALTDAATVAVDWDSFIFGTLTMAGNRTLGNPTNGQPGTYRTLFVSGNDGTGRTLTFDTFYGGNDDTITAITSTTGRVLITLFCLNGGAFFVCGVVEL